ncbi:hypothetical protein OTU49_009746 [Cherax quadricarinatus]|uniref:FYVE and coiled-coil domain-containing protein 1 n=1 Tax=Cherax quadricarinatus TaxID=27406 RepID=A0AAW0WMA7_CHEQU
MNFWRRNGMAMNRKPVGINFEKILQSLLSDVQDMRVDFEENGLPISDDNKHLHQFCDRLEFILMFGLRERSSVLGARKDLWQYFCKCLAERRNIHDGLKIVKANTELKTAVGRGRCFMRYCLVHQCLGDVIQQCVDNQTVTRQFYQEGALLLNAKLYPTLLNCLYNLCDVPFDLSATGHDLDVTWPTFARHGGGGTWRPPTRAVSLSSLSSFTSQLSEIASSSSQLANLRCMAPVGEGSLSPSFPESPRHESGEVSMEANLEVTSLQERLALLEGDNATLRASCASLQNKLDEAQQDSGVASPHTESDSAKCHTPEVCLQCEQLSEELHLSRSKCTELQCLHDLLENQVTQLHTQVDSLQAQEKHLKNEITHLEKTLKETLTAGERLSTGVHELLKETSSSAVPTVNLVTVKPEQCAALVSSSVISQPDTDSSLSPQQVIDQCQHKLENLEKENEILREQCRAAEMEKTALRTNIHKISEAEENLRQKVISLSQQEKEYENLQEEVEILKDKYEDRGKLLHIASERVTELEKALHGSEAVTKDTLSQLSQANAQIKELQELHNKLNSEYEQLKGEVVTLQQQVADLRFQVSSKDMEREVAVKESLEKHEALTAAAAEISEQELRISELEQQAASHKQLLLSQERKHTSQVNELTQNLAERDTQCSDLSERLHQTEATLVLTQQNLCETQKELNTTSEASVQLSDDNAQLREKIIQLLSRRVRVCDDCFSIQAELATIIASPASQSFSSTQETLASSPLENGTSVASATGSSHPLPIGSRDPDDDEYAVISDDEIHTSQLSSSSSSGSPSSSNDMITETRATKDILTPESLSTSPPTNAEVWVGAGTRVLVPIDLPAGFTLHWNFVSEPKSVSFAVLHQPQASSQPTIEAEAAAATASQQRVLIPTTRVASTQGAAVKGRLLTKQPGVYTLVFDNSFSRFTAKKVTYSLRLENQESLEEGPQPQSSSQT